MAGEEQVECPLCMEPLEIDDVNFFPCTCGYQICRFCWHRIRTDENGLCPACRKQYPEDPAEFKPLTEDELQRIKKERKQKDLQRKQKAAENRKHLANVRVVQKNLVFVVGLSKKLAETETLKKQEYFGKFGKIHKVVINQSTSYAGAQGPSASAYVTYNKAEDALKAILAVNNVHIDGRTLKASLGTTKYCSHFLKGSQCQKQDCMYLHELGEEAASFTKEEMQLGKHQEYEQKLLENYMNMQNSANNHVITTGSKPIPTRKKETSPLTVTTSSSPESQGTPPSIMSNHSPNSPSSNKDAWPSLQPGNKPINKPTRTDQHNRVNNKIRTKSEEDTDHSSQITDRFNGTNSVHRTTDPQHSNTVHRTTDPQHISPPQQTKPPLSQPRIVNSGVPGVKTVVFDNPAQSLSLFSGNVFYGNRNQKIPVPTQTEVPDIPTTEISESIQVSSCTDWQAAFGFTSKSRESQDDDLGFDPWDESSKGLADLLEKENVTTNIHQQNNTHNQKYDQRPTQNLPPGFTLSHIQNQQRPVQHPAFLQNELVGSRMMGFLQQNPSMMSNRREQTNLQHPESYNKDWQDGLRALLPNINISFGAPPPTSANSQKSSQNNHKSRRCLSKNSYFDGPRTIFDPAILSSGKYSDGSMTDCPPHWLKSITQLTELEGQSQNHRLPFVQQFPIRNSGWPTQTQNPPPGFQTRPPTQHSEPHKISEGLQ
ncbi:CCR4-NOT transcription complex subunit 4-like isoform X1 [Mytilus californianus]|uniref:CCR4-NOT transcription complex subunit 4-like isoform X1 n=1 Tax=Mytilus californianus TaxID=6549 RepID=UPI00224662AD|nr:CCR4-NOT transcription complex subunit 4-like isoform X1 [Mytilus californianus]